MTKAQTRELTRDVREKYAFHDDIVYLRETKGGLTRETVEEISGLKGEPEWMLKFRLRAFEHFQKRPMPVWTDGLDRIDFDKIVYYRKPSEREERSWEDVPEQIKATFERLGIPEAERKFLAGVGAQYDSEVVYHSVKEELSKLGVVFMGTDQGLKEYPEIFEKYFGTIVPPEDNKFAALNSAVWSGGSFVYVPPGVDVPLPLQAYFRINAENTGQFERTLIVVDEGAKVHYIEGCLPGSELVSLGDSFVPIETVEPGMAAMNSQGRLETVTAARKRPYEGPMLRIAPLSVGNAFELTPEHPVWTIRRGGFAAAQALGTEPDWIEAGKLEVGDLICFPVAQRIVDHSEMSDETLRTLGVEATAGVELAPEVMELPPSRQSVLLDGFFGVGGTTAAPTVAFQIQELLARAGVYAQVREAGGFWTIDREPSHVWFDEGRSCFWVPIREITSRDYSGFVYNLEMAAAPNAYLARGFAVHNCTAPIYATDALHAAVVEVIALPRSKVRYTTIQNWSNDVYNLVTKRAHAYEDATVEWIDANTGCLAADSMVLKNNDVVSIADIKPGDHVYSLTPQFEVGRSRVVATRENEPEQVYDLVLRNHRRVRATANHPFLVARKVGRTRKLGWTTLASIVPEDEIAIVGQVPDHGMPYVFPRVPPRKRLRVPFRAPVESTDDLMWVLGFYIGDGCPDGDNRIVFAIPDSDPALPRLRQSVRDLFGLEMTRGAGVQLRATSGAFVDWLKAAGFGGNAHTKRIPDWVFRLPHSQKRGFIDGYIAADGHVRERFRNIQISSASRELLEQVRSLAISAGINALKISTWTRREKLALGEEQKSYLANYLCFADEELDSPVHFVPITTIEPAGEQVTYDIEVEGTENFIANGVFVHNSKQTVKYPSIYLRGEGATADIISVAVAGRGQHQDTGGKAIHLAPNTRSRIVSKSVSKDGGRATYRGHVKVAPGATGVVASVRCDALMLDEDSRSDTYPYIDIAEDDTTLTHEAVVGKISAEQVFYLMSRGLTENEAQNLIIQGFLEVFTKELPMEYAIEFNRLVKMEMEGSLG